MRKGSLDEARREDPAGLEAIGVGVGVGVGVGEAPCEMEAPLLDAAAAVGVVEPEGEAPAEIVSEMEKALEMENSRCRVPSSPRRSRRASLTSKCDVRSDRGLVLRLRTWACAVGGEWRAVGVGDRGGAWGCALGFGGACRALRDAGWGQSEAAVAYGTPLWPACSVPQEPCGEAGRAPSCHQAWTRRPRTTRCPTSACAWSSLPSCLTAAPTSRLPASCFGGRAIRGRTKLLHGVWLSPPPGAAGPWRYFSGKSGKDNNSRAKKLPYPKQKRLLSRS